APGDAEELEAVPPPVDGVQAGERGDDLGAERRALRVRERPLSVRALRGDRHLARQALPHVEGTLEDRRGALEPWPRRGGAGGGASGSGCSRRNPGWSRSGAGRRATGSRFARYPTRRPPVSTSKLKVSCEKPSVLRSKSTTRAPVPRRRARKRSRRARSS